MLSKKLSAHSLSSAHLHQYLVAGLKGALWLLFILYPWFLLAFAYYQLISNIW